MADSTRARPAPPPRTGPASARWTHLALRVRDVDATIAFYESYTPLRLLERREDADGYGAWLGQPDQVEHPFVLVAAQFFAGHDPWEGTPLAALTPFNHIGIELPSAVDVDAIAARARDAEVLTMEPTQMPDPIGYICMVADPDGNLIEFSFGQGVYDTAQRVWGSSADTDLDGP